MDETRHCRDCGGLFTMTAGQIDFFVQRGLQLPKRCQHCRTARRLVAESGEAVSAPRRRVTGAVRHEH